MSQPKTVQTDGSVEAFLDAVGNPRRQADARWLLDLMREVTGKPPPG